MSEYSYVCSRWSVVGVDVYSLVAAVAVGDGSADESPALADPVSGEC